MIGILTTTDIEPLFAALPDRNANPVGSAARAAWVAILEGSTPGSTDMGILKFRDAFFPKWKKGGLQDDAPGVTGLDSKWWADLAAAVVCQAISRVCDQSAADVNQGAADDAVAAANQQLVPKLSAWYAHVLAMMPPVGPQLDLIGWKARMAAPNGHAGALQPAELFAALNAARPLYEAALQADDFLAAKSEQWAAGEWPDAPWELYHHYCKLLLLGATAAEIDTLIGTLETDGLPHVDGVRAGQWQTWPDPQSPGTLDWNAIAADATNGLRAAASPMSFTGDPMPAFAEGNTQDFIQGPGKQFRA